MKTANKSPHRMQLTLPHVQKGIGKEKKCTLQYPNVPSAIRPLPHGEGLPVPEPPNSFSLDFDEEEENTPEETQQLSKSRDLEFFMNGTSDETHKITQEGLYDLIRNL